MTYAARITKWGNSQAIRLPKEVLAKVNLREADDIIMRIDGEKIIIKKAAPTRPPYKSLEEIFANSKHQGRCVEKEINWGKPIGAEILDEYGET